MNYDNQDGKYQPAKLTEPQIAFLRRCSASGKPETVWPGTDTRVAHGLQRAGLVFIVNDLATLTDAGRVRLKEVYQYDHRENR